jgi:hypothetical protein
MDSWIKLVIIKLDMLEWRQNIFNVQYWIYALSWKLCVLFLCEIIPLIWTNEDDMQVFVYVYELIFFKNMYVYMYVWK